MPEAAKSKKDDWTQQASSQPMRAGIRPAERRNPSSDQKRDRRQMALQPRRAAEENPMTTDQQPATEAELLQAMASAQTIEEQRGYSAQLEGLRAKRAADIRAGSQIDFTALHDPGLVVQGSREVTRHTEASDWMADIDTSGGDTTAMANTMRAEANLWFMGVWEPVKADPDEFTIQAEGMAKRKAGFYGENAPEAEQVFIHQVAHLARTAGIQMSADVSTHQDPPYGPTETSSLPVGVKNEDTFDQPTLGDNTGEPQTEPGMSPSLSEGDAPAGDAAQTVENPAAKSDDHVNDGSDTSSTDYIDGTKTPNSHGTGRTTDASRKQGEGLGGGPADPRSTQWDSPSLAEGNSPEGDQAATGAPLAEDRNNDAAKDNKDTSSTDYLDGTKTPSTAALVSGYKGDNPFVQALGRLSSVDDTFAGTPGRVIARKALQSGHLDAQRTAALLRMLGESANPSEGAGGDTVVSDYWGDSLSTGAPWPEAPAAIPPEHTGEDLTKFTGSKTAAPDDAYFEAERDEKDKKDQKECPFCGTKNDADATECSKCGAKTGDKAEKDHADYEKSRAASVTAGPYGEKDFAKCPSCGKNNWSSSSTCAHCGAKMSALSTTAAARPLYEIAEEIRADWSNVYFGAKPYLDALGAMTDINDSYGADGAKAVIAYFLSNASTWRGDTARRVKKELKAIQDSGGSWFGAGQFMGAKQATRYCPTHKVYVGDGNQENHDHCPVETRKKKESGWEAVTAGLVTADDDSGSATCSVCGDKIEKDPSSEDPSTYHHDNGEKHDHEAKP